MKRRVGVAIAVGLGLLVIAVWLMRGGGGATRSATPATGPGRPAAAAAAAVAGRAATDPRGQPRASIHGTIRDEAGAPIAHARVCASATSWRLPDTLTRAPACSDSDEQGRYRLGNLLAADYAVHAAAPHFVPAVFAPTPGSSQPEFPLAAGEARTGVDLVLRRGGVEITGVVLDISGGPIAHAQVRAATRSGRLGVAIDCDDQGRFSMWVARGALAVTASADGYAPGSQEGSAPGHVEIRLTPAASLAGTVVDAATDQPVAGARVTVFNVREGGWYDPAGSDDTDADGKFRIEPLEPGRFLANAITARGYGRSSGSTLVGLGQHVDGVVVRMFPAHRVAGQIVAGGDRAPCPNGYVLLRDRLHERTAILRREPGGQLAADGVVPGTYDVTVGCEHHRARDHYDQVTVASDDITGLTWEVEAGARIHGMLRTRSGEPVEGAQLWAQRTSGGPEGGGAAFDTSRPDGSYELAGLAAGSFQVSVQSDRGVPPRGGYSVDVAAGANIERDLVLDDGGSVSGTVVDATGTPIPDITVTARPLSRGFSFGPSGAVTGGDGSFAIDALAPGEYRLVAMRGDEVLRKPGTSDDHEQGERATVRPAQVATVRLVIDAGNGKITGTVIDGTGQPVPDAFLASSRESDAAGGRSSSVAGTRHAWWGESRPVLTASDGSFVLTGLAPGKYTVRAYRKGGGEAVAEHVAIGATARLQIKSTGSIEGTVRRDGSPPRDLQLSLHDGRTGYARSEIFYQGEGHFRIADLPAGHFELAATGDGTRGSATIDLGEGEAKTGVAIALEPLITLTGRLVDRASQQPVPGVQMFASAAQGGSGMAFLLGPDTSNTSDASGRFTIRNAPTGKVEIRGVPVNWTIGEYAMFQVVRSVQGTGTVDLGDIPVLKQRIKNGEPIGSLGVRFAELPLDAPLDQAIHKISWIDPAGPAAHSELRVGDIIVSVDGLDVTGGDSQLFSTLIRAAPGTRLALGTQRGPTVPIVLAAP
jgi:protocatechuate 3,4-dioxygenase beta subunit